MRIAQSAYRNRDWPDPLQLKYARLVNPAGPLDGRRIARPRLLPPAGAGLPGAQRHGRRGRAAWACFSCSSPPSWCAKPLGCWWPRGSVCACAPFCCCPSAACLPTPTLKARKAPTRAAASLPSPSPVPLANVATALVLAASVSGRQRRHPSLRPAPDHLRLPAAQHGVDAGRPRPAAPAARLSAGLRPPPPRQLCPQARLRSHRPRRHRHRPGAGARRPWSPACCCTAPGSSSPASSS